MRSGAWALATATALMVGTSTVGAEGSTERCRDDNGAFLGQVKPVLYVNVLSGCAGLHLSELGWRRESSLLRRDGGGDAQVRPPCAPGRRGGGPCRPTANLFQSARCEGTPRARSGLQGTAGAHRADCLDDDVLSDDPDGHEIVFAETDPEVHAIDPW